METEEKQLALVNRLRTQLTVKGQGHGQHLLDFLEFLVEQMQGAARALKEETQQKLAEGDASDRINTLNALRLHKRKLEAEARAELGEVRSLVKGLKDKEEPEVLQEVQDRLRVAGRRVQGILRELMEAFEV